MGRVGDGLPLRSAGLSVLPPVRPAGPHEPGRGGGWPRSAASRPSTPSRASTLREFEGEWRIVDVFLDGGISEIATKRSEYGSVLARDGVDGLLAALRAKITELAAEE